MFFLLLLIFVVGPIAEIYVLLSAGSAFGVLPVVFACLATAAIGGAIIRLQGLAALNAVRRDMQEGRPPVASAADGVLILLASPFLMTPGFLTDAIGFALLIPQVRRWIGKMAIAELRKRMARGEAHFTIIER